MTQTGVKASGSHNSPWGLDMAQGHIRGWVGGASGGGDSEQTRQGSGGGALGETERLPRTERRERRRASCRPTPDEA